MEPSATLFRADLVLPLMQSRRCSRKSIKRPLPLLFFCYIIAYLDRVINVGFAKVHLRGVLGVDGSVFDTVFGLGSGFFFIGYFIFEVPSNLMLQEVVGACIWIAAVS